MLWKLKVTESCPIVCNPRECTVHRILQARILEWVDFHFSRGSSQPRSPTLKVDFLPAEPNQGRSPYWLSTLLNIFQIIFMEILKLHEVVFLLLFYRDGNQCLECGENKITSLLVI